jgi:hypothetical protein
MPIVHLRTRSLILVLVAGAAAAVGCTSAPLPLAAQAGATIAIPVASEVAQEHEIGYGSTLLAEVGRYDLQRGELQFHFAPQGATAAFTVSPRVVTRVGPDPGSLAAHANISEFNLLGLAQILALVDIPTTAQPGAYTIQIRRCRRTQPGGTCNPLSPDLPYSRPFTVLPGTGTPNPNTAWFYGTTYDTKARQRDLYPYPKVVFQVTGQPAASHAVITYPTARMTVKNVFEEQYGGSQSIVSWHDDPDAGQIVVDIVDPTRRTWAFAISFDLKDPLPGQQVQRVVLDDIQVLSSATYGLDGAPQAGTVAKFTIR